MRRRQDTPGRTTELLELDEILIAAIDSVEASLTADRDWQQSLREAVRSGRQLCRLLGIDPQIAGTAAEGDFPVFAPREFIARMEPGNPSDPLLLQVLATAPESHPGGVDDPVGDMRSLAAPGMLQKYAGRALVIASGACAIHCRYCFRRHFPYQSSPPTPTVWQGWLQQLRRDPSIEEVILSGGDPLSLVDSQLSKLVATLRAIPSVHRLRIHTRFPVVIPARVTDSLLAALRTWERGLFVVLHVNHANEIDAEVEWAVQRLRRAGAVLLNQAVLLRGVNDSAEVQVELCRRLVNLQVIPYYLHQLDPVRGAMHFQVDDATARRILVELRQRLPGYAVPELVREIPGAPSKTPL
ncbi:MAG: EF-P beta-lysylation protein EpmB [Planctomycetota bacterium]|nr:MAG: EF-P beta-lysylation protein EpmB [Planctomycetota bacterium]